MIKFSVTKDEHDQRGSFTHLVKWNPPARTGYILQYVEVIDPMHFLGNYEKPYYEAWKITDGKTVNDDFDDCFSNDGRGFFKDYAIDEVQRKLSDATGFVEYRTKVYWIDAGDQAYYEIENWGSPVSMASELPSSYKAPGALPTPDLERTYRVEFVKQIEK